MKYRCDIVDLYSLANPKSPYTNHNHSITMPNSKQFHSITSLRAYQPGDLNVLYLAILTGGLVAAPGLYLGYTVKSSHILRYASIEDEKF